MKDLKMHLSQNKIPPSPTSCNSRTRKNSYQPNQLFSVTRYIEAINKVDSNISSNFSSESETGNNFKSMGQLFKIVQPFLRFGQIILLVPSNFERQWNEQKSKHEYSAVKVTPFRKVIFILTQLIGSLYSLYRLNKSSVTHTKDDELDDFEILAWLWVVCFSFYFIYCNLVYLVLWIQDDQIIRLFEQGDALQQRLSEIGMPLIVRRLKLDMVINMKHRLIAKLATCSLMFAGVVYTLLTRRLYLFSKPENAKKIANTVYNFVTFSKFQQQHPFQDWQGYILALIGTTFDMFGFSPWFFAESLRLLAGLIMLKIFCHINKSVRENQMTQQDLPKILEVHMQASKLMRAFNDLLSPITFMGVIQSFLQACYIINIILWDYGDFMIYSQYTLLFIRNFAIYQISACVSTQAHAISNWLEDISAIPSDSDNLLSAKNSKTGTGNDMTKLTIFTSQVYCKDSIGFRGFDYFTVSNSFIAGIVSLLITYTVVITQFKPPPETPTSGT